MREKQVNFWKQICYPLLAGLVLTTLIQCSYTTENKTHLSDNTPSKVSLEIKDSLLKSSPAINYHFISTKDSSEWLLSLPPGDTLSAILVLNRIDRSNLLKHDTLVLPDTIGKGIDMYSPFPEKANQLFKVHKILLISYYAQAFAVYENGVLIKWGPASLGKQSTPTPTGLFATNWKSKSTVSTVDSTWIMEWYFNIDNFRGVSMHQYALPGYPASHACIRLYKGDAKWLYYWADQWIIDQDQISVYGTPVVIFGDYPFDQQKPWLSLPKNNQALEVTSSELTVVMQEFFPVILKRQSERDSLQASTSQF